MSDNSLEIAKKLIACRSISGEKDEGALDYIENYLRPLGFRTERFKFSGDNSYEVDNLYAEYGNGEVRNLCFAGHTDVVPEGDSVAWSVSPYKPEVRDGYLIGRGAVDMKGSIACFMQGAKEFISENKNFKGTLSFLITGDEEADSINGTEKVLKALKAKGIKISSCIVGEPTNTEKLGDMIKIGRRGGVSYEITVYGVQGHVAYPEKALNPTPIIAEIIHKISQHEFDKGTEFFQPTNLEFTTIDIGNKAVNVIPAKASAKCNIRFNNQQNSKKIRDVIEDIIKSVIGRQSSGARYEIKQIGRINECFIFSPGNFANLIADSVKKHTGLTPQFATTGGTSDARFIKDYCEVAEFGLINTTAHKVDEKVAVADLENLKNIYLDVIKKYFA